MQRTTPRIPRNSILRAAVLAALVPALMAGCSRSDIPGVSDAQANPVAAMSAAAPVAAAAGSQHGLPDFASLVDQNGASVVAIRVTKAASADEESGGQQLDPNDPMFEFFKRFGLDPRQMPRGGGGRGQQAPVQGLGSGFIVSADGYILTNAHVVDGATEVIVRTTDKRELTGKVIGSDKRTDVALVKVDAKDLPAVRIGDPANLRTGEWVAAIGSPFGLENTVTAGIVSAKGRSLPQDSYVPFIQTDVAVNPGNSGGPLFNMAGEVIGINSMIYSQTGGYMGLSFAIPIDTAMKIKEDLQKFGKVNHGRIGVAVQDVTKDLANSFKLDKAAGALIGGVEKDSPADKAGLTAGDVITAIDGKAVEGATDISRAIGGMKPGDTARLTVHRNGKTQDVVVKVGSAPSDKTADAGSEPAVRGGKLGVAVRPLTPEERKAAGNDGLLVERVGGAAAKAGIEAGDVILGVGAEKVASVDELKRAVDKSGKVVALRVQRGKAEIFVPVTVG